MHLPHQGCDAGDTLRIRISLVYIADTHCVYKLKYPLLIKKTSFEVNHCEIIEIVVLSRSAQAPKLKKAYS